MTINKWVLAIGSKQLDFIDSHLNLTRDISKACQFDSARQAIEAYKYTRGCYIVHPVLISEPATAKLQND